MKIITATICAAFAVAIAMSASLASSADALSLCRTSAESVGNFVERTPNTPGGTCLKGTAGKSGEFITVKSTLISMVEPGVACAEVEEANSGNYAGEHCTEKVEKGKFAKILTTEFLLGEWLVNGSNVTTARSRMLSGELTFTESQVKAKIKCSLILDGTINPGGEGTLTSLLNLSGEEIALGGLALTCTSIETCAAEPLLWFVNLPWKTLLDLMDAEGDVYFIDLFSAGTAGKNPGWVVECTVLGVKVSDECLTSEGLYKTTNEAGGVVHAEFNKEILELGLLKFPTCSSSKAETGGVEGSATVSPLEGNLTVSSE